MIVYTFEEVADILFGTNMPAQTAEHLGVADSRSLYRRLSLNDFYGELARVLGTSRPWAPYQWCLNFLAAGYSHASKWGLSEPNVRQLQRLMRDVLIPVLISDETERTVVRQYWGFELQLTMALRHPLGGRAGLLSFTGLFLKFVETESGVAVGFLFN